MRSSPSERKGAHKVSKPNCYPKKKKKKQKKKKTKKKKKKNKKKKKKNKALNYIVSPVRTQELSI